MSVRDELKHKLKILARLPDEPTDLELDAIIRDVEAIQQTRSPTERDWQEATNRRAPREGMGKYAGEDMSRLNALLMQLQAARPSPGPRAQGGGGASGTNTVKK